jgi:hypothetical protein
MQSGSAGPPSRRAGASVTPTAATAVDVFEAALARGDGPGAVRAVFPLVVRDVEAAFGTTFPPFWTDRDIVSMGLRPDSGILPSLMLDLYALYEPIRYGRDSFPDTSAAVGLVRRIYSETPLGRSRPAVPGRSTLPVLGRWPKPGAPQNGES